MNDYYRCHPYNGAGTQVICVVAIAAAATAKPHGLHMAVAALTRLWQRCVATAVWHVSLCHDLLTQQHDFLTTMGANVGCNLSPRLRKRRHFYKLITTTQRLLDGSF